MNEPISPERMAQAISYIELYISMCKAQMRSGRFFVLEHPAYASSWKLPGLGDFRQYDGVLECFFNQCEYGLTSRGDDGVLRHASKPTRVLTNSTAIAQSFSADVVAIIYIHL